MDLSDQFNLEGMVMRTIGRVFWIDPMTVSRGLVQAAQALPASPSETEACSFIAKKRPNVGFD
jgi:hypothetical protein